MQSVRSALERFSSRPDRLARVGDAEPRYSRRGSRRGKNRRGVSPLWVSLAQNRRDRSHQLRRCATTHHGDEHAADAGSRLRDAARFFARRWELWGATGAAQNSRAGSRQLGVRRFALWGWVRKIGVWTSRSPRPASLDIRRSLVVSGRADHPSAPMNPFTRSQPTSRPDHARLIEKPTRHECSFFARLEVVDVRSGPVKVSRIDRMSGAMDKVFTESTLCDH